MGCKLKGRRQSLERLPSQPPPEPLTASPTRQAMCCRCFPASRVSRQSLKDSNILKRSPINLDTLWDCTPPAQELKLIMLHGASEHLWSSSGLQTRHGISKHDYTQITEGSAV